MAMGLFSLAELQDAAGLVRMVVPPTPAYAHNVAEGAGAAALAALIREKTRYAGRKAGVVLSGGNIDAPIPARVLEGHTPAA
jgi:threonine dehydratase